MINNSKPKTVIGMIIMMLIVCILGYLFKFPLTQFDTLTGPYRITGLSLLFYSQAKMGVPTVGIWIAMVLCWIFIICIIALVLMIIILILNMILGTNIFHIRRVQGMMNLTVITGIIISFLYMFLGLIITISVNARLESNAAETEAFWPFLAVICLTSIAGIIQKKKPNAVQKKESSIPEEFVSSESEGSFSCFDDFDIYSEELDMEEKIEEYLDEIDTKNGDFWGEIDQNMPLKVLEKYMTKNRNREEESGQ